MTNIILGDGIAAYTIAAGLSHENKDFKIYGNNKYIPPSILLLKVNNEKQLEIYFEYFGLEYSKENIDKYTKKICIGYILEDNRVTTEPSYIDLRNYYNKQKRVKTRSSMSDSKKEFFAIDLVLLYNYLKNKFKDKHEKVAITQNIIDKLTKKNNIIIYNTIIPNENSNDVNYEYIVNSKNNLKPFSYLYDCRTYTKIKRFTNDYIEYFEEQPNSIKIKNYYAEPTIYERYNVKQNLKWIDISRNATKTQLKVEDIIQYIMNCI